MPEKFDVIIVGAGPAGTAAALALAKEGLKVVVFERGEYPGAKNMFGGTLYYTEVIDSLIPDFWQEAPIERYITRHALVITEQDAWVDFAYTDKRFAELPYNAVSLLRSKFDQWFAEKARAAGALIVPDTLIEGLVFDGSRVSGVRAGKDDESVHADVVILAGGANSQLLEKAAPDHLESPRDYAVAAKEILALSPEKIERRLNLGEKEGVCFSYIGDCLKGLAGGAFLVTNRSTLSIGVVARLTALKESEISIADLLEHFKAHAAVQPLVKDAVLKEYSGHMIPEGGLDTAPPISGDGFLIVGDSAKLLCSTGLTLQGMNYAMASGIAAAEAIKEAIAARDFSAAALGAYRTKLAHSFVLPSLQTFREAPEFLANPRLYSTYPAMLCGFLRKVYGAGDQPRKKFLRLWGEERKARVSLWTLAKDIWCAARGLLW